MHFFFPGQQWSFASVFVDERFIYKAQFDAGFAHCLILKDGEVLAIKDPPHDSELPMVQKYRSKIKCLCIIGNPSTSDCQTSDLQKLCFSRRKSESCIFLFFFFFYRSWSTGLCLGKFNPYHPFLLNYETNIRQKIGHWPFPCKIWHLSIWARAVVMIKSRIVYASQWELVCSIVNLVENC